MRAARNAVPAGHAGDVEQTIRALGTALGRRVDGVSDDVVAYVVARMPELGAAADGRVVADTAESARANIGAIAAMFAYGIPSTTIEPPHGAVTFARAMIRRGVGLPAILRAYRVGHGALWDAWMALAATEIGDPELLAAVLRATSSFMFEYMDAVCVALVHECDAERRRWARTAAAARAATARMLLEGGPADVDAASRALGYELGRHHIALILWRDPHDDDAGDALLEQSARGLASALGCADPLLVPAGSGVLWAWAGSYAPFDPAALRALPERAPDARVRIALGAPGTGSDGFRTSHEQADRTLRVLTLTRARPGAVARYEDVAFLAALCADPGQARAFAALELGPLAAEDPAAATLRATLAAFLESGCSHVRAARRLRVHEKTVTARVRRAEALLGHRVDARRRELAAALLVRAALPAAQGDAVSPDGT